MGGFISMSDLGEGLEDMFFLPWTQRTVSYSDLLPWLAAIYILPLRSHLSCCCATSPLVWSLWAFTNTPVFMWSASLIAFFVAAKRSKALSLPFFIISYIDLFVTLGLWTISTRATFHSSYPLSEDLLLRLELSVCVSHSLAISHYVSPLSALCYELCSSNVFKFM